MSARLAAMVVGLFLLFTSVGFSHGFSVVTILSFQTPDQLTVRLADAGLNPVAGAIVVVSAVPAGGKPGEPVTLAEGPAGTYTGLIPGLPRGEVEFAVEATVQGELHGAWIKLSTDRNQPELTRAMKAIETEAAELTPVRAAEVPRTWWLLAGVGGIAGAVALRSWMKGARKG